MRPDTPDELASALHDAAADGDVSGVIRIDHDGRLVAERGYGLADRAHGLAATAQHRFGVASISKGFTALAIGALIDDGALSLDTPARPSLGADLPALDEAVTVGHLLSHTSGIGDYLDETAGEITDHVLEVPVHTLADAEDFLPVLDGRPQVRAPGAEFASTNSGFVVLALIAQRVSGLSFHDLVGRRVFAPAGMTRSSYPRTDEPAADLAAGYLHVTGLRTNALHLPVRGSGDGGTVTTAGDLASFWSALMAHRIVSAATLEALTRPLSVVEEEGMRYACGFWRGMTSDLLILEGYDAGISGRTWHDPATGLTATVVADHSEAAWPVLQAIDWA